LHNSERKGTDLPVAVGEFDGIRADAQALHRDDSNQRPEHQEG